MKKKGMYFFCLIMLNILANSFVIAQPPTTVSQPQYFKTYIKVKDSFGLGARTVNGIDNDSTLGFGDPTKLATQSAIKKYVDSHGANVTIPNTAITSLPVVGDFPTTLTEFIALFYKSATVSASISGGGTGNVGSNWTFASSVTGGSPPYTYQWRKEGTNISGATNPTYVITNAQTSNAGNYSLSVHDNGGQQAVAGGVTLVINALPILGTPSPYFASSTDSTVSFAWPSVTSATSYSYGLFSDAGYTNYITGGGTSPTSATITGLASNTTYYFQVEALASGFTHSSYGQANGSTQSGTDPNFNYDIAYANIDPFISTSIAPDVSYYDTRSATKNGNLSFPLIDAAQGQYIIVRVPSTEPIKKTWYNSTLNNGNIGDSEWRLSFTIGSYTYYMTSTNYDFQPGMNTQLNN